VLLLFFGNPNNKLNQILLKPIKPNVLAININKKQTIGDISKKLLKIKNSLINLIVPGIPEKKITIIIINTPRLGSMCNKPPISIIDLE
jgi:hypothetical protein